MNVTLSFDDFNGQLHDGITANAILSEIQRVIEGATVRRAGANITYEAGDSDGAESSSTMNIEVHSKLGCMLHYMPGAQTECVSLADETRLTEIIENGDCNPQFAGLYMPPEQAIHAIKEFCRTGKPDVTVRWMDVCELPDLYPE